MKMRYKVTQAALTNITSNLSRNQKPPLAIIRFFYLVKFCFVLRLNCTVGVKVARRPQTTRTTNMVQISCD